MSALAIIAIIVGILALAGAGIFYLIFQPSPRSNISKRDNPLWKMENTNRWKVKTNDPEENHLILINIFILFM